MELMTNMRKRIEEIKKKREAANRLLEGTVRSQANAGKAIRKGMNVNQSDMLKQIEK